MSEKLDILAFGVHPDDVELSCAGTLLRQLDLGYKAGIIDLTAGELGTRGTPELRLQEANHAAKIMGINIRENLHFEDGFFVNDRKHQLEIIKCIRKYRPDVVLANAIDDRHPDHGRSAKLVADAVFLSGLRKIETTHEDVAQEAWRPRNLFHYIQYYLLQPDFLVDITAYMETKMEAIKAYRSQFHDPNSKEPETLISQPSFLDHIYERAGELGKMMGVRYAEGFTSARKPGVNDLMHIK